MPQEVREEDKSEFNAAIATLIRIGQLKTALAESTLQRDYSHKYILLEAYYMELISVMNEKELVEQEKRYEEARTAYWAYKKALGGGKNTVSRSVIDTIVKWEKDLRILEQKHDLNLRTKSDPRYSLR